MLVQKGFRTLNGLPGRPPGAARCADLASTVGNTPVLWIDTPFTSDKRGFWAKLEGVNPGGMKDRPALHMIARARERGDLAPGSMIIESSSGSFGLGLGLAGIAFGHPVTVVTDAEMEPIVRRMLGALGVRVEVVREPCPVGGWQRARRDRVRELMAACPGAYNPDQYDNPDHAAGYATLAWELVAQLGRIDVLVCSVGTGGHSAGVTRVLRTYFPHLRLVGVDTVGSTIFGQPAWRRLMRGLGSSVYPRNVDYASFDEVHWVAPAEAVWSCRQLAGARYVCGGWSVGAVALVAGWIARTQPLDLRVVAIFPDGPMRYFDTVYNDDYCGRHGLLDAPPAAQPDEIPDPSAREVTSWTRCRRVVDPLTRPERGEARRC
ncbi:cysteine synthase [Kutzneria sp. 744]|nr:cysteine synthase [Kutzneria sp. 744]